MDLGIEEWQSERSSRRRLSGFAPNLRPINLAFGGCFPKLSDRFSNYARELFQ